MKHLKSLSMIKKCVIRKPDIRPDIRKPDIRFWYPVSGRIPDSWKMAGFRRIPDTEPDIRSIPNLEQYKYFILHPISLSSSLSYYSAHLPTLNNPLSYYSTYLPTNFSTLLLCLLLPNYLSYYSAYLSTLTKFSTLLLCLLAYSYQISY